MRETEDSGYISQESPTDSSNDDDDEYSDCYDGSDDPIEKTQSDDPQVDEVQQSIERLNFVERSPTRSQKIDNEVKSVPYVTRNQNLQAYGMTYEKIRNTNEDLNGSPIVLDAEPIEQPNQLNLNINDAILEKLVKSLIVPNFEFKILTKTELDSILGNDDDKNETTTKCRAHIDSFSTTSPLSFCSSPLSSYSITSPSSSNTSSSSSSNECSAKKALDNWILKSAERRQFKRTTWIETFKKTTEQLMIDIRQLIDAKTEVKHFDTKMYVLIVVFLKDANENQVRELFDCTPTIPKQLARNGKSWRVQQYIKEIMNNHNISNYVL